MIVFVDQLTVRVWCLWVLPYLLWTRMTGRDRVERCDVLESSRPALRMARAFGRLVGVPVEGLQFRLQDIRDDDHTMMRFRIKFRDLQDVNADILRDPLFRQVMREGGAAGRLPVYLAKALMPGALTRKTLWRVLLAIQVCVWKLRAERKNSTAVLFLEQQPWFSVIARYAATYRVTTIPVAEPANVHRWLRRHLSPGLKFWLRDLWSRWSAQGVRFWLNGRVRTSARVAHKIPGPCARPRIAVHYSGSLNLRQPERHSDLFFWQQSSLSGRDLVLYFSYPRDPLDTEKLTQLNEHGIEAVALSPQAVTLPQASPLLYRPGLWTGRRARTKVRVHPAPQEAPCVNTGRNVPGARSGLPEATAVKPWCGVQGWTREAKWLREQQSDYQTLRAYWAGFFARYGIKIYVTWFKFDGTHCAMADALQGLGGVTALYQRVYEPHPAADLVVATDISFGFSPAAADIERRSGSRIPYHVTTGYLGDFRFAVLRQSAARVRQALHQQGARHILAFADEGTLADSRWFYGHEGMQRDYVFLLERVLGHPWLGLVLKPKVPSTLRRRLGPVAELLKRAEDTGRCVVYEGGVLCSADPPVAAALAADVFVHSFLVSGTAGMESALAGVPTLLLDREGWTRSPLYRLGVGRVVFPDLEGAWKACRQHWSCADGVPGFGSWASMLEELDPFRDGRAAERMGTYLQWLLEGFRAGVDRETVMADAAERYARQWGKDKITHVNTESPRGVHVEPSAETSTRPSWEEPVSTAH